MPEEILIYSSNSKYEALKDCNLAIGNGLVGDRYIPILDGGVCVLNRDYEYILRDRIKICLVGENMQYTDEQISCLEDVVFHLMKEFGVMRLTLRENYEEKWHKTFSEAFFNKFKNKIKIRWTRGE